MLTSIINNLTQEQRLDLHIKGVTAPVMSMWRTGKRRPTYAQCVSLAEVTGCNLEKLLVEVALNDATEAQKKKFNYLKKGFILPYLMAIIATICLSVFGLVNMLETSSRSRLQETVKMGKSNYEECTMSEVLFT